MACQPFHHYQVLLKKKKNQRRLVCHRPVHVPNAKRTRDANRALVGHRTPSVKAAVLGHAGVVCGAGGVPANGASCHRDTVAAGFNLTLCVGLSLTSRRARTYRSARDEA